MNGPQHYREAEKCLHRSEASASDPEGADLLVKQAQVHATLALVAARVDATAARGPGDVNPELLEVTA